MSQNLRNRSRGVPPDVVDSRRRRLRRVRVAVFAGLGVVAASVALVVVSLCGVPTVLTLLLTGPPHTYGSTSSESTPTSSPMWTPLTWPSGSPDQSAHPTPGATAPQQAVAITTTPGQKPSAAPTAGGGPRPTPTATPSRSATPPGKSGSAPGHTKAPGKTPSPTPSP